MKNLLTLTILVGGLSLHAMNDDAAQLKALENELAKQVTQNDISGKAEKTEKK
jgi:hypothetical protein